MFKINISTPIGFNDKNVQSRFGHINNMSPNDDYFNRLISQRPDHVLVNRGEDVKNIT